MRDALQLSFETSMDDHEARVRDLPQGVSRLLIQARSANVSAKALHHIYGSAIHGWKDPSETVYGVPINLFVSAPRTKELVGSLRLLELNVGSTCAFGCDSSFQLVGLLSELDYEELVVFFARTSALAEHALAAVDSYKGPGASHNAVFLAADTGIDGFVFYAPSHLSLELLGTREFVLGRCLRRLIMDWPMPGNTGDPPPHVDSSPGPRP
jgi:hypothetical protein